MEEALKVREARADKLLELDDAVARVVTSLKDKGFQSPYLKNFVVARINFLRFKKDDSPVEFDPTVSKMIASAQKFNVDKVNKDDITRMGGARRCGAGRGVGSQAHPRAPPPCRAAIWKPARRCPKLAGMAIKNLVNGVLATSAWFKNAEQWEAAAAQRATAS